MRDRPAETPPQKEDRAYFKSSNALREPLGYSRHAPRSALNASDPEGRVSIGVEAPLREALTFLHHRDSTERPIERFNRCLL